MIKRFIFIAVVVLIISVIAALTVHAVLIYRLHIEGISADVLWQQDESVVQIDDLFIIYLDDRISTHAVPLVIDVTVAGGFKSTQAHSKTISLMVVSDPAGLAIWPVYPDAPGPSGLPSIHTVLHSNTGGKYTAQISVDVELHDPGGVLLESDTIMLRFTTRRIAPEKAQQIRI